MTRVACVAAVAAGMATAGALPLAAQTDVHAYGGATVAVRDETRAFLGGAGVEWGSLYIGGEGYRLRPTGEARDFQRTLRLTGRGSLDATGAAFVPGFAVRPSERTAIIPVGIVGASNIELCLVGCIREWEMNYGGGVMVKRMITPQFGVHGGFRWTDHYGTAVTFGAVFRLGDY